MSPASQPAPPVPRATRTSHAARGRDAACHGDFTHNKPTVRGEANALCPSAKPGRRHHRKASHAHSHSQRAAFALPERPREVKLYLDTPLTWQDASPRQRRARAGAGTGSRAKHGGNHATTLFHFSPPSSLLGSVMLGGALHRGHAPPAGLGEGTKRKRGSSSRSKKKKVATKKKRSVSRGDLSSWTTNRGQNSVAASYTRLPLTTASSARAVSLPQAIRDISGREPERKVKAAAPGRRSRQQGGKPRFKITSGAASSRKRKKYASGKSSSAAAPSKTFAVHRTKTTPSFARNPAGSVFLNHLNFRPIRDGFWQNGAASSGTSCDSGAAPAAAEGDVNYQDWMHANASPTSSMNSRADAELSSEDAVEKEKQPCRASVSHDQVVAPEGVLDKALKIQSLINLFPGIFRSPLSTEEASQTCDPDLPSAQLSGSAHKKEEASTLHGIETSSEDVYTELNLDASSSKLAEAEKNEDNNNDDDDDDDDDEDDNDDDDDDDDDDTEDIDDDEDDDNDDDNDNEDDDDDDDGDDDDDDEEEEEGEKEDDEVADRELQEISSLCEKNATSSAAPRQTGNAKCLTPHVGRRAPRSCCSFDCYTSTDSGTRSVHKSTSSVSKSNSSTDSNSGTQSHHLALDESSKERVEQEFDLRLGRYMSLLCGEASGSPASRRLQARLLKHKNSTSDCVSNRAASLTTRMLQQDVPRPDTDTKPPKPLLVNEATSPAPEAAVAAPNPADPSSAPPPKSATTTTTTGPDFHENYSFNKAEDRVAFACTFSTRPPSSQRAHSSPAKDTNLVLSAKRGQAPSLRYLIQCAVSTHKNRSKTRQAGAAQERDRSRIENVQRGAEDENRPGELRDQKPSITRGEVSTAKPPAWRAAVVRTARSAQTDDTGCACGCLFNPQTHSATSGNDLKTKPGPFASANRRTSSFSLAGNISTTRDHQRLDKPPLSKAAAGAKGSISPQTLRLDGLPTAARASPGTSPKGAEHSRPCYGAVGRRRTSPLNETSASTGNTPSSTSPEVYKAGDFTQEVTSKVEADLQRYNAVMNRCRALLGERDPEEEDSSTWTQSSGIATLHSQGAAKHDGRLGDSNPPLLPELPGVHPVKAGIESAIDRSMGDTTADTKDCKDEKFAVHVVNRASKQTAKKRPKQGRARSFSADNRDGRANPSYLPPKRSTSNPHYKGVAEFGSVEAIRRLVDPQFSQAKPKVTFDIASEKSGVSISSTCGYKQGGKNLSHVQCNQGEEESAGVDPQRKNVAALSSSRTKKKAPTKKARASTKTSKTILKSRPKAEEASSYNARETGVAKVSMDITPMVSSKPRGTNEPCTSRKPVRTNPYYSSILGTKKGKRFPPQVPRPCSQTSWKTVDTDATARSPPPEVMANSTQNPAHTMKKKIKKVTRKVTDEASDASDTCHQKPVKFVGKKSKRKTRKLKSPMTLAGEARGNPPCSAETSAAGDTPDHLLQHGDCVMNRSSPGRVSETSSTVSASSAESQKPQETCGEVGGSVEPNSTPISSPLAGYAEHTRHPVGEDAAPNTREAPPPSPELHSRSCRSVSFVDDPTTTRREATLRQSRSSKPSPKSSPTRQRTSGSSESRMAADAGKPCLPHAGSSSSQSKPILNARASTTKPAAKNKRILLKAKCRPLKKVSAKPAAAAAPEPEPLPAPKPEMTDIDRAAQEERLEACRRAFLAYKSSHPELGELSTPLMAPADAASASVLRKCGPLMVALMFQMLVQYAYS